MPLSGALERHAARIPANPAFEIEGRVLSYGSLAATARQAHAAFAALAPAGASLIGPQTRLVALLTGNHALFPAAFAAATAGGTCAALIDPHLPEATRGRLLEKLAPDVVVTAEGPDLLLSARKSGETLRLAESVALDASPLPQGNRIGQAIASFPFSPPGRRWPEGSDEGARLQHLASGSPSSRCRDLLPAGEKGQVAPAECHGRSPCSLPEGDDDGPFLIVFTSGTTADPKPIIRDRRSWRVSLASGAPFFGIDAETGTYAPGPLAHGLALYAMTETLLAGATFHSARHFDAAEARTAIRAESIRRLVLVPTMLRRLCEGAPVTTVSAVTVAGAKLTAADHALCAAHFPNAALREYYGASELGFITVTAPGDPASSTAVGRAFPGVRLSVRDDAGAALPAGETGTIFVESPLVATGYLGAEPARFGALATVGDLGFLEAGGTLHLLGRSGGMVLSGGNNIYPSEVEAALTGLAGVRAAHIFGLDHADLGSELVAVVEPAEPGLTATALRTAMDAALPRYKQPRRLWLCRALPVTPSGKVEAKTVRQWVAEDSDALERLY